MTPKEKLIEKAKTFGINTEGLTIPQLTEAIAVAESQKLDGLRANVIFAKEAYDALPQDASDEAKAIAEGNIELAEKELSEYAGEPVEEKPAPGTIELNGSVYAFKKAAPARFNFLGRNKTQEEWLQDPDAMELLIAGNSSFVKPIKK